MATGPNMATITASLERSLQNCSLNNHRQGSTSNSAAGAALTDRFSDSLENHHAYNNNNNNNPSDDATLELNSEISLPYHWEQCLDLQVRNNFLGVLQSFVFIIFSVFFLTFIAFITLKVQILDFIIIIT